jgi:hypothetical protein
MFRLYLDAKELILPANHWQTLSEVIEAVKSDHLQPRTLIQKLSVDGQNFFDLGPELLDQLLSDPNQLETVRLIEVFTSTPIRVANETVEGALAYLDKLIAGVKTIAEHLRMGNLEEAFKLYRPAIEGVCWTIELLSTLEKVFQLDYGSETFNGVSVRWHIQALVGNITRLVDAQEKNDWILMADVLEYELADAFAQWKLMLKHIGEQVAAKETSKAA